MAIGTKGRSDITFDYNWCQPGEVGGGGDRQLQLQPRIRHVWTQDKVFSRKTLPKPKRALQLSAFANVLLLLGNSGGRKCVAGEGIE